MTWVGAGRTPIPRTKSSKRDVCASLRISQWASSLGRDGHLLTASEIDDHRHYIMVYFFFFFFFKKKTKNQRVGPIHIGAGIFPEKWAGDNGPFLS